MRPRPKASRGGGNEKSCGLDRRLVESREGTGLCDSGRLVAGKALQQEVMQPCLNNHARTVVGVQRHIVSVSDTTEESPCGGRGDRPP